MSQAELRWSTGDLDRVGWHDVRIYGVAAVPDRFELYFDIDYIVEWLCPPVRPGPAKFRIAPATVRFEDVACINVAVESQQGMITIQEVGRTKLGAEAEVQIWRWVFRCEEGTISFDASGFQIVLRQPPILSELQYVPSERRGLPSFAWPTE